MKLWTRWTLEATSWLICLGLAGSERGACDLCCSGLAVAAEVDAAVRKPVLGRDQVEADDPVTRIAVLPHDVVADEAGRTGDEHGEGFGIHALRRESTAQHHEKSPHDAPSVPGKNKARIGIPPGFRNARFYGQFSSQA